MYRRLIYIEAAVLLAEIIKVIAIGIPYGITILPFELCQAGVFPRLHII